MPASCDLHLRNALLRFEVPSAYECCHIGVWRVGRGKPGLRGDLSRYHETSELYYIGNTYAFDDSCILK